MARRGPEELADRYLGAGELVSSGAAGGNSDVDEGEKGFSPSFPDETLSSFCRQTADGASLCGIRNEQSENSTRELKTCGLGLEK